MTNTFRKRSGARFITFKQDAQDGQDPELLYPVDPVYQFEISYPCIAAEIIMAMPIITEPMITASETF